MTRKRWLALHRYIGLTAGVMFVLLGLSGTLITYQQELDAWLHPGLLSATSRGERAPAGQLQYSAQAALPGDATLRWARLPHDTATAVSWFYRDAGGADWEVLLDPHTGQILGHRRSDTHVLAWIYRFHANLLAGLAGNVALGVAAVVLLVLLGVGLRLWWPRHGRWRQALTIKRGVGTARLYFDLHRASGAYAAVLLLTCIFTGVYMALPPVMEATVSLFSPVSAPATLKASGAAGRITLDEAIAIAQRHLPGTQPKVLVLPSDQGAWYEINLYRTDDRMWRKTGEWTAFVDAATGELLRMDRPGQGTGGDRFIAWMFPLHNGEAFGEPGRAIVALLGIVPLMLGATGLLIWRGRRRHLRGVQRSSTAP